MKKPEIIDQLVGSIYILLSFYFINRADADPTPVDEFNIYWMFTLSAMSLGGFLIVANSKNKYLYWGTRGILVVTILYPIYLVFNRELGAAFYFPWIFLIFGGIRNILSRPGSNREKGRQEDETGIQASAFHRRL